jgi:hypothetical protein
MSDGPHRCYWVQMDGQWIVIPELEGLGPVDPA